MRARAVVEGILLERLSLDLGRDGYEGTAAADGHGQLGFLPVFTLDVDSLRLDALGSARKVGWRYFWINPAVDVGAVVVVRPNGRGDPKLARYQWGAGAIEYAGRLDNVLRRFGDAPGRQRLRILRLAPLQMEALWVTGRETERLVGLVPELEDQHFLDEAERRYLARKG